ncbi:MAG: tRNA-dihydrouridine synthase family protein [Treponema sp.]|jgi:tRNA-dihydrouridine synthase|nr:tRNA-dihydrouridine synthase family protein [Treponema sp.]
MAEISHRALRELIEGFGGCDEYFTEMISAPALLAAGPFEKWYIDNGPCPEKLVYQLVGADSAQIAGAAALLDSLECKGIDLNMGCCAPLIRKTGGGIAWMASVDKAGELVRGVRKAAKRRLSVKLRIGFTEDFDYLAGFCRRLESEGAELITLHPRTAKEKLKRLARWDYVGALRQELGIPVAGNGDVLTADDLNRRAGGPCDAVMVGRAAIRQPWIFARARLTVNSEQVSVPIPDSLLLSTGLKFIELLARWQPPEFHISRARRFFGFFCDNLKWGNYLKNLLNREETLLGMERVWREHFHSPVPAP